MKEGKGHITIGRGQTSHEQDDGSHEYVTIEVHDAATHALLIVLRMTPRELGQAITGLGYTPCRFVFYEDAPVGKVLETKTEEVSVDANFRRDGTLIPKALAPYQVDGWEARSSDVGNWYNVICRDEKFEKYRVNFRRYVDPPAVPVPPA
jgi:hypothetical protein